MNMKRGLFVFVKRVFGRQFWNTTHSLYTAAAWGWNLDGAKLGVPSGNRRSEDNR